MTERISYASAGVDIAAGERAVDLMREAVARTVRPEVIGGLGGFAGLFKLDIGKYTQPLLASSTDGVGTKIAIAQAADRHDTIGIDMVAMVVDDLVVVGAEPLFLTDYIATGRVVPEKIATIVGGNRGRLRAGRLHADRRRDRRAPRCDGFPTTTTSAGRPSEWSRNRPFSAPSGSQPGDVLVGLRFIGPAFERVLPGAPRAVRPGRTAFGRDACRTRRHHPGRRTSRADPASMPGTAWPWPAPDSCMPSPTSPAVVWPAIWLVSCPPMWMPG